jgi:flagellar motility protein MotE (MotC chaperone)
MARLRFFPRLNLLPLLLATLLLGLMAKIGAVWLGFPAPVEGMVAEAAASQPKPAALDAATEKPGNNPRADNTKARPACETPSPLPGPAFSDAEITVLQQLAQRRAILDSREQELEQRQALIAAVEMRISAKLAEMQKLQAALDGAIKRNDADMETRIRSLVKIYELMKPADAARIFETLDMETLLPVAGLMSERKLAPVMAQMNPTKATDITQRLKQLRDLTTRSTP